MEADEKEVEYHSKDFDWVTLKAKYEGYFSEKNQKIENKEGALKDYENSWEAFYQENLDNFFKDRKYLLRSFEEIADALNSFIIEDKGFVMLEAGCGVGNTLFPLLKDPGLGNLFLYGFDISETAVKLTQSSPLYDPKRLQTFVCNILKSDPKENLPEQVDFCTCVFFLSSFLPCDLPIVLSKLDKLIKKGGIVFIRDYGLYDLAMIRNEKKGNIVEENCFKKGDGIVVQYFSKENLGQLFEEMGYEEVQNEYCTVERMNKKTGVNLSRVFVNAKFRKK